VSPNPLQPDDGEPAIGPAALMRMVSCGADLADAVQRASNNPNPAHMLMGLSTISQLTGSPELGLEMQAKALQMQQLYRIPAGGGQATLRLLAITSPGPMMGNTPVEFLLEGSDVALDLLYMGPDLPFPATLPDHDVLFIAVAGSDENRQLLQRIGSLTSDWPRPVLNRADRIAGLARDAVCARLQSAPGIAMPNTARIERQALERVGRGELSIAAVIGDGDFPIIARPLDSQGGRGLMKLDAASAIADYLQARPEDTFYVARFVDYRGPDGLFRKYRIVLIDGRPFACHMGISADWMIHYKNAGMEESAEKRAEEARFMAGFDEDFARRHESALRAIAERMDLDYLVMDCAETANGRLLIFEVDSTGFVHALDPVDIFPYKQPQMRKVFDAFRAMLAGRVHSSYKK
jgi:glutathione synthase/RimK-type ligase-like ATP-grasp enzyme